MRVMLGDNGAWLDNPPGSAEVSAWIWEFGLSCFNIYYNVSYTDL